MVLLQEVINDYCLSSLNINTNVLKTDKLGAVEPIASAMNELSWCEHDSSPHGVMMQC